MNEQSAVTGTVVDNVPSTDPLQGVRTEETSLARVGEGQKTEGTEITLGQLAELGFIMPVATPEVLRAAFDNRQKMIAAILDPRDYLYTVPYVEQGRTKQQVCQTLEEAKKWAGTYKTEWKANPKKSGVVKIAVALGIRAERMKTAGLPDDPKADFAYCVYKAVHKATGAEAEGVGWCDKAERGNRSTHDLIAMADTRAYCRAVLRLAGLGDVSADEIIAGGDVVNASPITVVDSPVAKRESQPLPPLTDVDVLAAARAWASEIVQRAPSTRYADQAAQDRGNWPQVRAKARRGDSTAAAALGKNGIRWVGTASDGPEYESFYVSDESPVSPEDIERVEVEASKAASTPAPQTQQQRPATTAPPQTQQQRPATQQQPASRPATTAPASTQSSTQQQRPAPAANQGGGDHDHAVNQLTDAQRAKLSNLLIEKLGTKDAAREWLKTNFQIESTAKLPPSQYEAAVRKLNEIAKS